MPFRIRTSISSIATLWLSSLFISIRRLYVSKICRWYLEKPTNQTGHSACFPKFIISLLQARSGGHSRGAAGVLCHSLASTGPVAGWAWALGGNGARVWTTVQLVFPFSWGLCPRGQSQGPPASRGALWRLRK